MSTKTFYERRSAGLCVRCKTPCKTVRCPDCAEFVRLSRRSTRLPKKPQLTDERSMTVIAGKLGITRQAVDMILRRAIDRLTERLQRIDPNVSREDVLLSLARLAVLSGETQPRIDRVPPTVVSKRRSA